MLKIISTALCGLLFGFAPSKIFARNSSHKAPALTSEMDGYTPRPRFVLLPSCGRL